MIAILYYLYCIYLVKIAIIMLRLTVFENFWKSICCISNYSNTKEKLFQEVTSYWKSSTREHKKEYYSVPSIKRTCFKTYLELFDFACAYNIVTANLCLIRRTFVRLKLKCIVRFFFKLHNACMYKISFLRRTH